MSHSKPALRKHFRDIRTRISPDDRERAAVAAAQWFTAYLQHENPHHIACYLPFRDECETRTLIETIWQADKICYLPVLSPHHPQQLLFVQYDKGNALQPNRFSILEPTDRSRMRSPEQLDVVITPLLAFDRDGHRLGTGGGYYDYTFSFLATGSHAKPRLIGLAYAAQEAEHLPADPWDVPLAGVVTEEKIHIFQPGL